MNHLRRQSSCNSAQHKDIMPETTIWSHGRARHGHGHGQQQQQQQHVGRYTALPVRQSQPQRAGHRTPDTGHRTGDSSSVHLSRRHPAPRPASTEAHASQAGNPTPVRPALGSTATHKAAKQQSSAGDLFTASLHATGQVTHTGTLWPEKCSSNSARPA
jgi:hypothetical protein